VLYRITSTVHFLIYFFFSISVLQFSLPAILIVMIALLNDAATLVISVDNAAINSVPDKWRLGQLLTISVILGILLTGSSFAHYFIARVCLRVDVPFCAHYLYFFFFNNFQDVFHLCRAQIENIIYLQVSSCPHFMIFGTRVQDHFWTNVPSPVFIVAIVGTQIFAMFVSIYGFLNYGSATNASYIAEYGECDSLYGSGVYVLYSVVIVFTKIFFYLFHFFD